MAIEPLNYERREPGSDYRWAWASISLSFTPVLLLLVATALRVEAEVVSPFCLLIWLVGFAVGALGLWGRGKAKQLAFLGILLNLFVPPLTYGVYFLIGMGALARGMGG